MNELTLPKIADFELTGEGDSPQWAKAEWQALSSVDKEPGPYATRFKCVWSDTGIYFLFECEDQKLVNTMTEDFSNLWEEDVIEVFIWTDESQALYFEYEISPLGVELPILVPNSEGRFMGWLPWQYEGPRRVRRATSVQGGEKKHGASCESWKTEFFIPFALFYGLGNVPPKPGAAWRANMYRIDFDQSPRGHRSAWETATGGNFHNYKDFGVLRFGE